MLDLIASGKRSVGATGSVITGGITLLGVILIWLPTAAFVWEVMRDADQAPLSSLIREQWSPRLVAIWQTNLYVALAIAGLSTMAGLLLHRVLLLRRPRERPVWLMLFGLGLVSSPYFLIQGWLNLMGPNTWLQRQVLPPGFSLYSLSGYIFVQVLLNSGLALMIIHGSRALLDRKYSDFSTIYQPSFLNRFRTIFRIQYLPPLLVSFGFIFLQAYWHYDAASMLQQNLLSLELMTAFGSFYDNGQAAAIVVPACLAVFPVAWLLCVSLSPLALSMKAVAPMEGGSSRRWPLMVLVMLPVLTLGVSLVGLLSRFSSASSAWESLKVAQGDFANTAQVGLLSGMLLTLLSLPIAWHLRVHGGRARWILLLFVMAFSIPALVSGIGFIHLRGLPGEEFFPEGPMRLAILNVALWLPVCTLLALASLSRLPLRWLDEIRLLQISFSSSLVRMISPFVVPASLQVFMVAFALSIREVPASLLNYSPDGGTVAITIETMLHFEQPDALSALCLAQFSLVMAIWGAGAAGLHFLRKRMSWAS